MLACGSAAAVGSKSVGQAEDAYDQVRNSQGVRSYCYQGKTHDTYNQKYKAWDILYETKWTWDDFGYFLEASTARWHSIDITVLTSVRPSYVGHKKFLA